MYSKIILFILLPFLGFSQAPQKINFQSILRNTNGEIVANKSVSLKISILSGSISGSSVYSETHAKTTDASGLISLQIGNGTELSGVFANIGWGNTSHFIKLEADFNGGTNFVLLGTQELMSVPYALYASKTDTSVLNLANRLVTKLNISDTASMLTNYRTELTNKVNISDTATMLLNYLRKSDTIIIELQNQLRLMQNHFKIQDIDGNYYNTVTIGSQTWMSENLRVSRYRNGDAIPLRTIKEWTYDALGWRNWYNNDSTTYEIPHGNLYNWYSATDSRGLCPISWHLPSENEWKTLIDYLGGISVAGGKMKIIGTTYWNSPNVGATNESGFNAYPSGARYGTEYTYFSFNTIFWSSTSPYDHGATYVNIYSNGAFIEIHHMNRNQEVSVRCLKD